MVAAQQAAAVKQLLENPAIRLASLDHVEGLARRFPYFQPVILKRGSVDPGRNIPAQDVQLLATTANLVIPDSLHPALAYLLLEAAQQTHGQPSLLNRPGEFPSPKATDFPLAEEADRYFKNGRPFLQRYLPFWLANFVQRLILMLIPLVAILVPVFKVLPARLVWKKTSPHAPSRRRKKIPPSPGWMPLRLKLAKPVFHSTSRTAFTHCASMWITFGRGCSGNRVVVSVIKYVRFGVAKSSIYNPQRQERAFP